MKTFLLLIPVGVLSLAYLFADGTPEPKPESISVSEAFEGGYYDSFVDKLAEEAEEDAFPSPADSSDYCTKRSGGIYSAPRDPRLIVDVRVDVFLHWK